MYKAWILAISLFASISASMGADNTAYNRGVEAWRAKDYVEARKQWRQSLADGGPDEAMNNLGFLLYHGLGGDADPGQAVELWRKAAVLAVSEAQQHLGQAYEDGLGVPLDRVQALAWYLCSIASAGSLSAGDETEAAIERTSISARDGLLPLLSKDEVEAGQRIAQSLIAKYSTRLDISKP